MADDREIELIKRRKMQEYLAGQQHAAQEEAAHREYDLKKQSLLRQILAPEARERLNSLRMTRPEFVEQIEMQLITLMQSGRLRAVITDEQLRDMLQRIMPQRREITIKRVSKTISGEQKEEGSGSAAGEKS